MESGEAALKKQTTNAAKLMPVEMSSELQEQIKALEKQVAKLKERNLSVEQELISCKKQLGAGASQADEDATRRIELQQAEIKRLNDQMAMMQEEFEGKLSETTQVQNLKKMLQSKNDQVKDLKARLEKYEKTE